MGEEGVRDGGGGEQEMCEEMSKIWGSRGVRERPDLLEGGERPLELCHLVVQLRHLRHRVSYFSFFSICYFSSCSYSCPSLPSARGQIGQ